MSVHFVYLLKKDIQKAYKVSDGNHMQYYNIFPTLQNIFSGGNIFSRDGTFSYASTLLVSSVKKAKTDSKSLSNRYRVKNKKHMGTSKSMTARQFKRFVNA